MFACLKALADSNRLRLLGILAQGNFTVQELTAVLGMGQSRISHHLKILSRSGLVSVRREGTWGYYSCDPAREDLKRLWPIIRQALNEIPEHVRDLEQIGPVLVTRREKSRTFFDRHYRNWDEMSRKLLPVVDYRDALLESLPSAAVLVELGVGTGSLLPDLSRLATRVIGIDHSPSMLDEARRNVFAEGLDNVELRLGDLVCLPLADNAADVVLLNMVLHHAADPPGVLVELRRVLRPGGQLIVSDLPRHDQDWVRDALADQWLGFEPAQLEKWLEKAGFSSVRCRQIDSRDGRHGVFLLTAEISAAGSKLFTPERQGTQRKANKSSKSFP